MSPAPAAPQSRWVRLGLLRFKVRSFASFRRPRHPTGRRRTGQSQSQGLHEGSAVRHDPEMPPKLPPHLHRQITRHRRVVWYFRRGKGPRIRIRVEFNSREFWAAYEAALGPGPKPRKSPPSGSFAWAAGMYRQSQAWASMSPATRRKRDYILARIVRTHGETPIAAWKRGDIAAG